MSVVSRPSQHITAAKLPFVLMVKEDMSGDLIDISRAPHLMNADLQVMLHESSTL